MNLTVDFLSPEKNYSFNPKDRQFKAQQIKMNITKGFISTDIVIVSG